MLTSTLAVLIAWMPQVQAAPIDELQPGHWYEVPNSRLDSVDPCPAGNCSWSGNLGLRSVMDAWSGGAFDTRRNRLMIWGGGHNSYAGNELYAFDIQTEEWIRLSEPSNSILEAVAYYLDGKPTSRHTYNDIQYDSINDRFMSLNTSASYSPNGKDFQTVDAFDLAANNWIRLATRPDGGGTGAGAWSAYNPATGEHFIHLTNGGRLQRYNPATNSWSNHVVTGGVPIYMTADVDPTRNILVSVGGGKLFVYDLAKPDAQPLEDVASGDQTAQNSSAIGFAYDSASDKFVAWVGGTAVYTLDPETWVWSKVNAAAGSVGPSAENMNGTYGRFRYIPSKNAFILVNNVSQNVYYYKLSAGGGVPDDSPPLPSVSFNSSPASVTTGSSATLTWSAGNATGCSASGAWSGSKATSGSFSTGALQSSSTYTLSCSGDGGTSSKSVTVTVSSAAGGVDADADWLARSTAPGVVMATRFDSEADVSNWIAGTNGDHLSWDQSRKASGNGSLRFAILKTDGASSGNWARWLADDHREFLPGDTFYVQYRQYVPAYLATHDFVGGGGWKQSIISRHAASMNGVSQQEPYGSNQLNEIVIQNTNHRGIVQGYNRDTEGRFPPWEVAAGTGCSSSDFIFQNAVDRGPQSVGTACENDRARYGGLYSYYQTKPSGYQEGAPDPLSGGFRYYPDEWLTIMIEVKLGQYGTSSYDTQVKVYAAREGKPYELIIDRRDLDLGDGPGHDTLWLLPYNTDRQPDSSRQDTFTNYDEAIVSTQFIPAPNTNASGQVKPNPPSNLAAD